MGNCCNNSDKSSYEGDMETRLAELGKNIDSFVEKAAEKADNSKCQAIDALKQKRDEAASKLKELKESGKDAFSELKKGTDRAWEDLLSAWDEMKVAGDQAVSKFQH